MGNFMIRSLIALLTFTISLSATIINVPSDQTTIQIGINAAVDGDTVLVQPGTYFENIFWPETNGIKLISAGDSSNTIIDGGGISSVIYMNPQTVMIDTTTLIQGFKITNGGNVDKGAGVFMVGSGIVFNSCSFMSNSSSQEGGGIYLLVSHTRFINCRFSVNHSGKGGALYSNNSTLQITNSNFNNNSASAGGAIWILGGAPELTDVVIENNTASYGGGLSYNATPVYSNVIIRNNSAYNGGGIYTWGGSVENVTIYKNTAQSSGGAVYFGAGSPIYLTDVIMANNMATRGGAVFNRDSARIVDITNCSIVGNMADSGGAISIYGHTPLTVNNSTIYNNISETIGGVWLDSDGSSTIINSNLFNKSYSVRNDNNILYTSAQNNWWGDSSGPYHPFQNLLGQGDSTNIFVNATPWLTSPDVDAPPIPAQNVLATATGNDFVNLNWDSSQLGDFAGFKLHYDSDESGYPYANSVDLGSNTSHLLTGLNQGTEYFLAVTVYDTDGNESWYSNEVVGVTRVIEVQNLDIAGDEELQHITSHDPLITFDYFDSMGEPQTAYQIQISTDSTFQSGDIWDTGIVSSDATFTLYDAGMLENGITYHLRAKVASGAFWSEWAALSFRMNTGPSSPELLAPTNGDVVTTQPTLKFLKSNDAEDDILMYSVYLYNTEERVLPLDSLINYTGMADTINWTVSVALDDNAQHWWTVKSYDGYEYNSLSEVGTFLFNINNDAPNEFSLISPVENVEVTSLNPILTWYLSDDLDPLDTVSYVLYLDTPDPGVQAFTIGADTSYQIVTTLLDNTTYSWKVIASDLNGASTENTGGYQSFRVNTANDLPTAFNLLAPEDGAMLVDLTPTLMWEPSSDPDDGVLLNREVRPIHNVPVRSTNATREITAYQVYLDTDSLFTAISPVAVFGAEYTPEIDLSENTIYYWKVEAVDDDGGTLFSDRYSFWTNANNEAPAEFSLLLPAAEEVVTVLSPSFTWESSSDTDLYDGFEYNLVLGSNPGSMDTIWSGADTTLTLDWELDDNTTYYWAVFAKDWSGLPTFNNGGYQSFTVNTSNDLPSAFELLSPVAGVMVTDLTPEFLWEASSDPDDETIVMRSSGKGRKADQSSSGNSSVMVITGYDFYLGTDVALTDVVPVEVIGTSYTPDTDLTENQVYYWSVSALDDSGGVTFSDTTSFWTNSVNSAPSDLSLLTPVLDAETGVNPTFSWTASEDEDLQDEINYTLKYGPDVFSLITVYTGINTVFTPEELLSDNTEYIWQVVATDMSGATYETEFFAFFVNSENDIPADFNLVGPDSGSYLANADVMLVWNPTIDLEGDAIEYRVLFGETEESMTAIDTVDLNYYHLFALEDSYYVWQIEAMDGLGATVSSPVWGFLINANNNPPSNFDLLEPDLVHTTDSIPTFRWEASDPGDPGDEIVYRLYFVDNGDVDWVYAGVDTFWTPGLEHHLGDNSVWFWYVTAVDLADAVTICNGESRPLTINMFNDPPEPADLISPDSVVVLSDTPNFEWRESFDPDPWSIVSYEVHWWTETIEMDSILTDELSATPDPLVVDNLQYFWNVTSMDGIGGIAHSEEKTFWVDFMPEAPGLFSLIGPDSASAGNGTRPELTWETSFDPDPFDRVYYHVVVATDSLLENVVYENISQVAALNLEVDLENDTRYYWQITANDEDTLATLSETWTFDVGYLATDGFALLPEDYVLKQNYPNPFNPSTTIRYGLPEDSNVSLVIYDLRGNVVQTIESGTKPAGWHNVVWNGETNDGRTISTGIYFAKLVAGDYSKTIKMLYLK